MLARYVSVVGGATLPFLLYAALAVILTPALVEGWPRASRWRLASALTGAVGAVVFATLRTLAIISSRSAVTIPTLITCVVVDALLLVVLAILTVRPSLGERGVMRNLTQVIGCAAIAMAFFRAIPEIILQLTAFIEPGESTFSSEMLLRVLGFLGGWAGVAILAFIYYRSARRSPKILTRVSLLVFALVFTAVHVLELMNVLHATHRMQFHGSTFRTMTWGRNNAQGVILLTAAAVWLVPMALALVRALGRAPAQDNPARTRALRSSRRRTRRWVLAGAAGFAVLAVTRTIAVMKVNEVPTLSAPEPYDLTDAGALIPTSLLADGHLHRFAYDASGGTQVRFIVILKNGGAYGVGLDACESCGPSGYYESDGKVICKRCDVAINPATIGFKGGCNPIPIDFTVSGGTLTVARDALESSAKVFA